MHRKNPDFVLHIPGKHQRNTLVIEVKGTLKSSIKATKQKRGIEKDIDTLKIFTQNYNYDVGILICYNLNLAEVSEKLRKVINYDKQVHGKINIIAIKREGYKVESCLLSDIFLQNDLTYKY